MCASYFYSWTIIFPKKWQESGYEEKLKTKQWSMRERGSAQTGVGRGMSSTKGGVSLEDWPLLSRKPGFSHTNPPRRWYPEATCVPFGSCKIYSEKCGWVQHTQGNPRHSGAGLQARHSGGGQTDTGARTFKTCLGNRHAQTEKYKIKDSGPPVAPDNLWFLLKCHKKLPDNHGFGIHGSVCFLRILLWQYAPSKEMEDKNEN